MKFKFAFLHLLIALPIISGCAARMGAPRGSSDNPVAGAVAGVAGLVDAKSEREKMKQKQEQKSVNDYLEKQTK